MTKKRKKKHNKIIALAKSKLNTIETLSSALNDSRVNHEEFTNIITEKNIYENIKENIKDTAELSSLERTAEPSVLPRIEEKSTRLLMLKIFT